MDFSQPKMRFESSEMEEVAKSILEA